MEKVLEVKKIGKKYQHKNGETIALKDVSFTAQKGEYISIIGPSGCREIYIVVSDCRIRRKNRRRN